MPNPKFSVLFPTGMQAPCRVQFTDLYQLISDRIYRFDFGDGHLFDWDYASQTVCYHTYKAAGIYQVTAIAIDKKTASEPVEVIILGKPEKKSFWQSFIDWLEGLFVWPVHP